MRQDKLLLAGQWMDGDAGTLAVRSPFDGRLVARVARTGAAQLRRAADAAAAAAPEMAALTPERRAHILEGAGEWLRAHRDSAARVLVAQAGKPLALARAEVDRAGDTFRDAAHVARHPRRPPAISVVSPAASVGWPWSGACPPAPSWPSLPSTSR